MKALYDVYTKSGDYIWSIVAETEAQALYFAISIGCENVYSAKRIACSISVLQ